MVSFPQNHPEPVPKRVSPIFSRGTSISECPIQTYFRGTSVLTASDRQPNSKWKKKGETPLSSGKRLARENLQLMLYLNLCKLMEMFPRQPEKLSLYMNQSLLEVPTSEDEEEPAPPTPPTP